MSNQQALIHSFYSAFQKRDYKTMSDCYHPEATFKDEAFQLEGPEIGAMWHMLCERGTDMAFQLLALESSSARFTRPSFRLEFNAPK